MSAGGTSLTKRCENGGAGAVRAAATAARASQNCFSGRSSMEPSGVDAAGDQMPAVPLEQDSVRHHDLVGNADQRASDPSAPPVGALDPVDGQDDREMCQPAAVGSEGEEGEGVVDVQDVEPPSRDLPGDPATRQV